ncbi:hypothetical protein VoSk93_43440 [Vibrio owensii]
MNNFVLSVELVTLRQAPSVSFAVLFIGPQEVTLVGMLRVTISDRLFIATVIVTDPALSAVTVPLLLTVAMVSSLLV